MPEFREHKTSGAVSAVTIHVRHRKTLFFEAEWQDVTPVFDTKLFTAVFHPQPGHHKGDNRAWLVTILAASPGSGALQVKPGAREVAASTKGKNPPAPALLEVTTLKELALPQINSDAGVFARVLLHETASPGFLKTYNAKDDLTAMNYLRNILENRRSRRFDLFGFTHPPTLVQMLHDPTQYAGLSTYPNLPHSQLKNIEDILSIANNDTHPQQPQFAAHVENALSVATQVQAAPDPSPHGLYAWKTAHSSHPGGYFTEFVTVGNLTFYTLVDDAPPPRHGAKN